MITFCIFELILSSKLIGSTNSEVQTADTSFYVPLGSAVTGRFSSAAQSTRRDIIRSITPAVHVGTPFRV